MSDEAKFVVTVAVVLTIYGLGYWFGRASSKPATGATAEPPDLWQETSRYQSKDGLSITEAARVPLSGVTLKVDEDGKVLVIERRRYEP